MLKKLNSHAVEFALDLPITVGNLTLKPVLMKDFLSYFATCEILTQDKANINFKYIKNDYYYFLCDYIIKLSNSNEEEEKKQGQTLLLLLATLFSIVLEKNVIPKLTIRGNEPKISLGVLPEKIEDGKNIYDQIQEEIEVNREDFEDIRSIIIYQNNPDFIDYDDYSKDVQDLLKAERRKAPKGEKSTLEDKVDSLISATGMSIEDIQNMTIRRFNRLLDRVVKKMEYQIVKTGVMSGLVSFKDKKQTIPSWTSSIDKNPLDGILVDYDKQVEKFK